MQTPLAIKLSPSVLLSSKHVPQATGLWLLPDVAANTPNEQVSGPPPSMLRNHHALQQLLLPMCLALSLTRSLSHKLT